MFAFSVLCHAITKRNWEETGNQTFACQGMYGWSSCSIQPMSTDTQFANCWIDSKWQITKLYAAYAWHSPVSTKLLRMLFCSKCQLHLIQVWSHRFKIHLGPSASWPPTRNNACARHGSLIWGNAFKLPQLHQCKTPMSVDEVLQEYDLDNLSNSFSWRHSSASLLATPSA